MLLRRLLKLLMKSMLTLLPCRRMDGQVLLGGLLVALLTGYYEDGNRPVILVRAQREIKKI